MATALVKGIGKISNTQIDVKRIGVEVQRLHCFLQELQEDLECALESDEVLQQWQSSTTSEETEKYIVKLRTALNILLKQISSLELSEIDRVLWPIKAFKLNGDIELMARQIKQYLDIINIDIALVTFHVRGRLLPTALLILSRPLSFQMASVDRRIAGTYAIRDICMSKS